MSKETNLKKVGCVTIPVKEWVSRVAVEINNPKILRVLHNNQIEAGLESTDIILFEAEVQKELGQVSKSVSEEGRVLESEYNISPSPYALGTGISGIDIILTHELVHIAHRDLDIFSTNLPQPIREHYINNIAEPRAEKITRNKILGQTTW